MTCIERRHALGVSSCSNATYKEGDATVGMLAKRGLGREECVIAQGNEPPRSLQKAGSHRYRCLEEAALPVPSRSPTTQRWDIPPRGPSVTAPGLRDRGRGHGFAQPSKLTGRRGCLDLPSLNTPSSPGSVVPLSPSPLPPSLVRPPLPLLPQKMLAVFAIPHSSASGSSSSDAAQPWHKVRAWFSRERGRAGKILQVALLGAAIAASASTNVVTSAPHRPTTTATTTTTGNAVWDNRPEMESRLRDTRLTMIDWVNIRRAEEYQKMVDGALPPLPSETETGSRTRAVKRKPVPSLDNFQDERVRELHLVKSGFQDENGHEAPYTWQATFPGSPHDFRDSASDQEEDSDQDSYDQDMDFMPGDSDSEDETFNRGLVVAEMCSRWGWTLEDVLETLEQPGLGGRPLTHNHLLVDIIHAALSPFLTSLLTKKHDTASFQCPSIFGRKDQASAVQIKCSEGVRFQPLNAPPFSHFRRKAGDEALRKRGSISELDK
ncbi:hypothetical protein BC827DRAFT_1155080 [Russula dissimulans]|nr:hypothetical protein BC827DRAFT_1155080 [Russula dissimulans]